MSAIVEAIMSVDDDELSERAAKELADILAKIERVKRLADLWLEFAEANDKYSDWVNVMASEVHRSKATELTKALEGEKH